MFYLIGLIVGKGRTYDSGRVVIDFSHTNRNVSGLARCPKCNYIATQQKGLYSCKNSHCGISNFVPNMRTYDQISETRNSISNNILPFLRTSMKFVDNTIQTNATTLLLLDFDPTSPYWEVIRQIFGNSYNFQKGLIPQIVWSSSKQKQVQFVNGILDTIGLCSKGGWLPRNGKNSKIRQRVYIQVVRNWKLVVDIDNFLREQFDIPIQTIDWGHPNIRDGNLVEHHAGNASAYAREHQLKIYPEYLSAFQFRLSHKQSLFKELLDHNLESGFSSKEDWFPPGKIKNYRAIHPDETNPRMIAEVRKHFDSFWQINLALGCRYLVKLASTAKNPEVFALTGDLTDSRETAKVIKEIESNRNQVSKPIKVERSSAKSKSLKGRRSDELEIATYPLLQKIFDEVIFQSNKNNGEFFITNYSTISAFMKDAPDSFIELFEECEDYKIRPDLVGFDKNRKKLIFIESKVDPLDLDMLGQLLAYCLVADPIEAYLVSTKGLSARLVSALSANPKVLEYGNKSAVKLGKFSEVGLDLYDF
jgi:hypothetical protein